MTITPNAWRFPLERMAPFSGDGRLYLAFDHLIAAKAERLLLVPMWLTAGDLRRAVPGCPCPWEDVLAILQEAPEAVRPLRPAQVLEDQRTAPLVSLADWGWRLERFTLPGGVKPLRRVVHESGVCFAPVLGG